MCGIVGVIAKNKQRGLVGKERDIFTTMLLVNQLRGLDGTGMFGVGKEIKYVKVKENASTALSDPEVKKFLSDIPLKYNILIGHNRKATKGTISKDNSHPFNKDHITLVHNGTLFGHRELANVDVDSEAIAIALSKQSKVKKVLEELKGSYALSWFDKIKNVLYVARNDDRPLYLFKAKDAYFLSSEIGIGHLSVVRSGGDYDTYEEIESGKLYEFGYKKDNNIYINKYNFKINNNNKSYNYNYNYSNNNNNNNIRKCPFEYGESFIFIPEAKGEVKTWSAYNQDSSDKWEMTGTLLGNPETIVTVRSTYEPNISKAYECMITNYWSYDKKWMARAYIIKILGNKEEEIVKNKPTDEVKLKSGVTMVRSKLLEEFCDGCGNSLKEHENHLEDCDLTIIDQKNYLLLCPDCADLYSNGNYIYE